MTPKLTIVIPTLNRAGLLARAIDSALAQTVRDVEIIVSNNGSSDGTSQLLAGYTDPRLKILQHSETIDACSHGNFLLAQARGELFLGLSDDDFIAPDFAAHVIDLFTLHPQIGFAYTGCDIHYANVTVPAQLGPPTEPGTKFLQAFLNGQRDVCWCACVTRTADLRAIGDIPYGTICGDMHYWTKLAATAPVGCIDRTLSHYIAFQDTYTNHSTGTPVLAWAREVAALAEYMTSTCISASSTDKTELWKTARTFVARSTADQFIWNALRGASRTSLLAALPHAMPQLAGGGADKWLRIAAAIAAPRGLLRQRVLAAAKRKADAIRRRRLTEPLA